MNTTAFPLLAGPSVADRTALLFEGQQYSYSQLQERVHRLANGLAELGVGPGDRVATMQVNTHQNIELYFASALLDAIYVPLNFRARAGELAQMLEIAGPGVLFIGQRYLPLIEGLDWLPPEQVVTMDCPPGPGQHSYEDLLQAPPDELHFPEGDDDDTTVIMFTSGTTSVPKGVQLTHDSFASYLLATVEPADPDVEETNLLTVPLYHIACSQLQLENNASITTSPYAPPSWLYHSCNGLKARKSVDSSGRFLRSVLPTAGTILRATCHMRAMVMALASTEK